MEPVKPVFGQSQNFESQKNTNELLQQDLKNVKASLSQTAAHARDKASDLVDEAKKKTSEYQGTVVEYVRTNPLAAIGYSVLAGFLVALLIRGK